MSSPVPRFETAVAVVRATNDTRERVTRALDEYLGLSARMREFEDTFSVQVLHAAQQLHEIMAQRRRLEADYERIRLRAQRGGYEDADELEDAVRTVLVSDDADYRDTASPDEEGSYEVDDEVGDEVDDGIDEATRRRIVRDFKRVVLPAVHADTSDSSFSVFDVAYSAYKARDYVVMEALVIRLRGEIAAYDQDGRTVAEGEARSRLHAYRAAARRLDQRLRALRARITDNELNFPERTRLRMEQRNDQIRQAIDEEAERILELRGLLETLVNNARDGYQRSDDGG